MQAVDPGARLGYGGEGFWFERQRARRLVERATQSIENTRDLIDFFASD
jgi:hypothetical protein